MEKAQVAVLIFACLFASASATGASPDAQG
jgi:hypothetical protein